MTNYQTRIAQISDRKASNRLNITKSEKWVDYLREAMQPMSNSITNTMVDDCNEIENKLKEAYLEQNICADFMITGSTLFNTHISEKETIDLVIIYTGFGKDKQLSNSDKINYQEIIALRNYTYKKLNLLYPEAKIDDSLPLALEMSNPSRLNNFRLYFGIWQNILTTASGFNSFSNPVKIFNNRSEIINFCDPIKSLFELNKKDNLVYGNIKSLIRILKNLKADSDNNEHLSGYEITSILFSMESIFLDKPPGQILFLLLECSLFLKKLIDDPFLRRSIKSPYGKAVFYSPNETKLIIRIKNLKTEIENLIKHLVLEIDLYTNISLSNPLTQ